MRLPSPCASLLLGCVQKQWLILAHAHSNSGFEPAVRLTDEERELQRLAKEQEKVLKAARKA
jgi:hypothetical protein